jgi:hypothetical protein
MARTRKPAPTTTEVDREVDERSPERIAARAYELYLARGGSDGQDFDDWLAAERELSSGPSRGPSQGDDAE